MQFIYCMQKRVDILQLMLEAESNLQEADEETKADLKSAGLYSGNKKTRGEHILTNGI